jgi:hypothetical protein
MSDVSPTAPVSGDAREELFRRLAGISGALAYVAHGCRLAEGPQLWTTLEFLSDELCDMTDEVEQMLQAQGLLLE